MLATTAADAAAEASPPEAALTPLQRRLLDQSSAAAPQQQQHASVRPWTDISNSLAASSTAPEFMRPPQAQLHCQGRQLIDAQNRWAEVPHGWTYSTCSKANCAHCGGNDEATSQMSGASEPAAQKKQTDGAAAKQAAEERLKEAERVAAAERNQLWREAAAANSRTDAGPDGPHESPAAVARGGIDSAGLESATSDLLSMFNKYPAGRKAEAEGQKFQRDEAKRQIKMAQSPEQRQREAETHKIKIRQQRRESEAREREQAEVRKQQARKQAAMHAGAIGLGRVPVDVGAVVSAFEYEMRPDELLLFVPLPEGTNSKQLQVRVASKSSKRDMYIGLKGESPYLAGALWGPVHPEETVWYVQDGELVIEMQYATSKSHTPEDIWQGFLEVEAGCECMWQSTK